MKMMPPHAPRATVVQVSTFLLDLQLVACHLFIDSFVIVYTDCLETSQTPLQEINLGRSSNLLQLDVFLGAATHMPLDQESAQGQIGLDVFTIRVVEPKTSGVG